MQRYQVGDEVVALGRGQGVILSVATPGHLIDDICRPVMPHLARLSLQGKRFTLPRVDAADRFCGSLTHYLIETESTLQWVPWHLTRRVSLAQPTKPLVAMPWALNPIQVQHRGGTPRTSLAA